MISTGSSAGRAGDRRPLLGPSAARTDRSGLVRPDAQRRQQGRYGRAAALPQILLVQKAEFMSAFSGAGSAGSMVSDTVPIFVAVEVHVAFKKLERGAEAFLSWRVVGIRAKVL